MNPFPRERNLSCLFPYLPTFFTLTDVCQLSLSFMSLPLDSWTIVPPAGLIQFCDVVIKSKGSRAELPEIKSRLCHSLTICTQSVCLFFSFHIWKMRNITKPVSQAVVMKVNDLIFLKCLFLDLTHSKYYRSLAIFYYYWVISTCPGLA